MSSENAKRREVLGLEWQGELDSHLSDLDSRLKRSRRAAKMPEPVPEPEPCGPPSRAARDSDRSEVGLRPGKMLMIRFQIPRLPWPFRLLQRRRRRREHPLTTAKVRV